MSKTFTTYSGKVYTTTDDFTSTVLAVSKVEGNLVNPSWKKPMLLITLQVEGKLESYVSEEYNSLEIGSTIRTHATINPEGIKFLSIRHVKKVA